ncbi:MAG: hypothetical protein ACRDHU_04280, partial [Actinomycetota bacterium]
GWEDCPRSIATAFLDHPGRTLDTSCVDEMPHLVFETALPGAGPRADVSLANSREFSFLGRW